MKVLASVLCVLVAVLAVSVTADKKLWPPLTFLRPLSAFDPIQSAACLCTGEPALQYGGCDTWRVCQPCSTGQITHMVHDKKEYIDFGLIGSVASSYIDLGRIENVSWTYSLPTMHYSEDKQEFEYMGSWKDEGWKTVPKNLTDELAHTKSGYQLTAPFELGKYYLVRVTNKVATDMKQSTLFMTVAIVDTNAVRWTIFWLDQGQAPDCLAKNIIIDDANKVSLIFTGVSMAVLLIIFAIGAVLIVRKINHMQRVSYTGI